MSKRFLILGDVDEPSRLFKKLNKIIKKNGPFSAILCSGSFPSHLPQSALLQDVPPFVPIFYVAKDFEKGKGRRVIREGEKCLVCIREVDLDVIDGIRVLFVDSGGDGLERLKLVEDAMREDGGDCIDDFGVGFRGVDILISPLVPRILQKAHSSESQNSNYSLIEKIGNMAKPRYHFYSSPSTYVCCPLFECKGASYGTRVIGLAHTENSRKKSGEKGIYALEIKPLDILSLSEMSAVKPAVSKAEDNLYDFSNERKGAELNGTVTGKKRGRETISNDQYFWGATNQSTDLKKRKRSTKDNNNRVLIRTPVEAACWFCLGNGKDPHLVISIGKHIYLALAKGGLLAEHVIIIPKAHLYHSLDSRLGGEVVKEIDLYKLSLKRMFKEEMGHVMYVYERAIETRGGKAHMHMQIHVIPVGTNEAEKAGEVANEQAERCRVKLEEPEKDESCVECIKRLKGDDENVNFFWAELPNGVRAVQVFKRDHGLLRPSVEEDEKKGTDDSADVDQGDGSANDKDEESERQEEVEFGKHPLHFGRSIGAALVRRLDRVDWKRCVLSKEEEERNAQRFKKRFAKYDPQLVGD